MTPKARLLFAAVSFLGLELAFAAHIPAPPAVADFAVAPSIKLAKMQSLGDGAFFFRAHALQLQHTGNLGGVIVPYFRMNYALLAGWLTLLDRFDGQAQVTPTMAAFLFGGTQNGADTRYIIDYLEKRAMADPVDNWRWLAQAVYLARYRLRDAGRAQSLAHELATLPIALPSWARDMEVFVAVDRGDMDSARRLLDAIAASPDLPDNERRWVQVYAERTLGGR